MCFLLGGRRRAIISDKSKGVTNDSRHANYENLKIEVQFDTSSERGRSAPPKEYGSGKERIPLGNHKRDTFQKPNTQNQKLHERVIKSIA